MNQHLPGARQIDINGCSAQMPEPDHNHANSSHYLRFCASFHPHLFNKTKVCTITPKWLKFKD